MKADVRRMLTADGSHTVVNQRLGTAYHSIHGAIQESQRVYIELGLLASWSKFSADELHVFEMGFGTGLNALLTAREAENRRRRVFYTAIEAYPLPVPEARELNYDALVGTSYLHPLHELPWNTPAQINPFFCLTKLEGSVQDVATNERFHLIYYDAFAPTAQPELWEPDVFEKMAHLLLSGGLLTTYCSRSYVQRNLRAAGFTVEKHAGPARKREVLRAIK